MAILGPNEYYFERMKLICLYRNKYFCIVTANDYDSIYRLVREMLLHQV